MDFIVFKNSAENKLRDLMDICKNLPGVFKDFDKASKELNILFAITVKDNVQRETLEEKNRKTIAKNGRMY